MIKSDCIWQFRDPDGCTCWLLWDEMLPCHGDNRGQGWFSILVKLQWNGGIKNKLKRDKVSWDCSKRESGVSYGRRMELLWFSALFKVDIL